MSLLNFTILVASSELKIALHLQTCKYRPLKLSYHWPLVALGSHGTIFKPVNLSLKNNFICKKTKLCVGRRKRLLMAAGLVSNVLRKKLEVSLFRNDGDRISCI